VPEPELAVVPELPADYLIHHPASALLVVEVAQSSVAQDRLTKAVVYATASVPEYWIVNLRDNVVEWFAEPCRGVYLRSGTALRGEVLRSAVLTGPPIAVDEVLPLFRVC
jgi:Uma2 family endonuclease